MTNNFMAQFDTVSNSEKGAKLHFKLSNGEPAYLDGDKEKPVKPVTVSMLGSSSNVHKKFAIKEIREFRLKSKKERNKSKEDKDDVPDTFFEDTAKSQVNRLVEVVTEWENMLDDKGGLLPCTRENVKLVFTKYQALRLQAIEFIENDANFIAS